MSNHIQTIIDLIDSVLGPDDNEPLPTLPNVGEHEVWSIEPDGEGGFYLEGDSPIHGWFCMEVYSRAELTAQLIDLGFSPVWPFAPTEVDA